MKLRWGFNQRFQNMKDMQHAAACFDLKEHHRSSVSNLVARYEREQVHCMCRIVLMGWCAVVRSKGNKILHGKLEALEKERAFSWNLEKYATEWKQATEQPPAIAKTNSDSTIDTFGGSIEDIAISNDVR